MYMMSLTSRGGNMVTYEAMNMLFHFGMLFVTTLTAFIAIVTLVTNKKEK